MDQPTTGDQADRIDRLEQELTRLADLNKKARREVAHLKWVMVALVLGSMAGVYTVWSIRMGTLELQDVFGSAMPKKVESKEFGLYNRDGKRVFFADYDKWGYPSLVFLDLDLNYRMGLKIYGDGSPGMVFYDGAGTRASFRIGEKGEALLQLLGKNQKGGIFMETSADGTPHLKMADAGGRVLFEAPEATKAPGPASTAEPESAKPEKPTRPRR